MSQQKYLFALTLKIQLLLVRYVMESGVIKYEVPIDDVRFGKLFRCPNNLPENDLERQEKLRKLSNLEAYNQKTFALFDPQPANRSLTEQASIQQAYHLALQFAENLQGWFVLQGTYGCGKNSPCSSYR